MVAAEALEEARGVAALVECTCGGPGWRDGKCWACRNGEAEAALKRLMLASLAQAAVVEGVRRCSRGWRRPAGDDGWRKPGGLRYREAVNGFGERIERRDAGSVRPLSWR